MNFTLPWTNQRKSTPIDDVKKQISQQVDQLAKVASDVSRDLTAQAARVTSDAGSSAAGLARDAGSSTAGFARDAGSSAAGLARDIGSQVVSATHDVGSQAASAAKDAPATAATLAQQALRGASQLGRDLRKVRITTEEPKRGPDIMPGIALLAGLGGGIALMYFLDPGEGRRRRALFRDQVTKWTGIGRRAVEGRAKDLSNRTAGLAHEARKAVDGGSGGGTEATDADEFASPSGEQVGVGPGTGNGYGQSDYQESNQRQTSEVG